MNIIGIICEYNPFHNGHLYHINKIKELFPDSLIVLVLNGYFMQRGEVSIISKKDKVSIALKNNIDIILELPFVFGTQGADIFASTAIKMLEELKCEYIVFGSESNDLNTLNKICDYTINNQEEYNKKVKELLKTGVNYPTAMAKAIDVEFDFNSNDLLAISYIKAIKLNNYKIKPLTIKRTNNYLDTLSNEDIISASNIRLKINNNININKYVPKCTLEYINRINFGKLFELLKYKIIVDDNLKNYLDVDEGIEYRLKRVIINCNDLDDLVEKVKSKRYTYNKIRRMLLHILLEFTKKDNEKVKLEYIKVLGFNKVGAKYLNTIKKEIDLPLTPLKDDITYKYEIKSSLIYDLLTKENNYTFEISNKPIIDKKSNT